MTEPLCVAFVWHMHQPYYKASPSGPFELPWVRLHGLRDYLRMLQILEAFPRIHQTFNLVPSLVEQLLEYGQRDFSDSFWDHTMKPADELSAGERAFVVDIMCDKPWLPRVQRLPRYAELARKKEECLTEGIDGCTSRFTIEEIRDLQVLSVLSWMDQTYLEREPLRDLVAKGLRFSEEDKRLVAAVQAKILAAIIPAYRDAAAAGRIEVTTSPYFHPILPLLTNTDSARIAVGDIRLPRQRFAHREDAREQIRLGLEQYRSVFGTPSRGMWCSEQAVGEDVIPLLTEAGVSWTISDEAVLFRSLGRSAERSDAGHVLTPDLLYRAYEVPREGSSLTMVFRDRVLSDLIGFAYKSWAPQDAAANLIWRLREARKNLARTRGAHLVTIALDGENAWDFYANEGSDFLRHLYADLEADPGFRCVTVGEFLEEHPARCELPWLHTGSWICGDLTTWIGDPAHGDAWDFLHRARDYVAQRRVSADADPPGSPSEAVEEAWRHILIAEGSDWFWWFGDHQESGIDYLWDLNFRRHLQEAYVLLGESPPPELFAPILAQATAGEAVEPQGHITPAIDGTMSSPEEWSLAGRRLAAKAGAMQPDEAGVLREIRYGSDEHNLYFLFVPGAGEFSPGTEIALYVSSEQSHGPTDRLDTVDHMRFYGQSRTDAELGFGLTHEVRIRLSTPREATATLARATGGDWVGENQIHEVVAADMIELALPLAALGVAEPRLLEFVVAVARHGILSQLLPPRGAIKFDLTAVPDHRRQAEAG